MKSWKRESSWLIYRRGFRRTWSLSISSSSQSQKQSSVTSRQSETRFKPGTLRIQIQGAVGTTAAHKKHVKAAGRLCRGRPIALAATLIMRTVNLTACLADRTIWWNWSLALNSTVRSDRYQKNACIYFAFVTADPEKTHRVPLKQLVMYRSRSKHMTAASNSVPRKNVCPRVFRC